MIRSFLLLMVLTLPVSADACAIYKGTTLIATTSSIGAPQPATDKYAIVVYLTRSNNAADRFVIGGIKVRLEPGASFGTLKATYPVPNPPAQYPAP